MKRETAAGRPAVATVLLFSLPCLLAGVLGFWIWPSLNWWGLAFVVGGVIAYELTRQALTGGGGRRLFMPVATGGVYAALLVTATVLLAGRPATDGDAALERAGIHAPGWRGRVDAEAAFAGHSVDDSRLEAEGSTLRLTTRTEAVYWNPANVGRGDYTVKATFHEPKPWPTKGHPHPSGLFIGGTGLDTDAPSLVYCVTYGDGRVLVRGFSKGKVFTAMQVTATPAVHRAEPGESVTNEIMWRVAGDRAECSINGTVVAGYDKRELMGPDALESFDGVAGIRAAADVDLEVTGLAVTNQ